MDGNTVALDALKSIKMYMSIFQHLMEKLSFEDVMPVAP